MMFWLGRKTSLAPVAAALTNAAPLRDATRYALVAGDMPAHLPHFSAQGKLAAAWNIARRNGGTGRSREGSPPQATLASSYFR